MSFQFRNLNRLGGKVPVTIPRDDEGYLGRECPQETCEGYFKVKPGTGLTGSDLPCHCPYCGHTSSSNDFWTKAQLEYAKSVVMRQVSAAIHKDLKTLEFDHKPKGLFGIGMSLKVKAGQPVPIRYYREEALETKVTCGSCTLDYAVYGLFGFCPDCGVHNSLQILGRNLDLVLRQLELADSQTDPELQRHLREDALENCVSAFDGFGRELCRAHASRSSDPEAAAGISFQNLTRANARLSKLFGVDLQPGVSASEWSAAQLAFQRRHLIAHKAGVADARYLEESGDSPQMLGRRISVSPPEVATLVDVLRRMAAHLFKAVVPGSP
jgi:hypothetical protein